MHVLWFLQTEYQTQVELSGKIDDYHVGRSILTLAIENRKDRRCKLVNIRLKRDLFSYGVIITT